MATLPSMRLSACRHRVIALMGVTLAACVDSSALSSGDSTSDSGSSSAALGRCYSGGLARAPLARVEVRAKQEGRFAGDADSALGAGGSPLEQGPDAASNPGDAAGERGDGTGGREDARDSGGPSDASVASEAIQPSCPILRGPAAWSTAFRLHNAVSSLFA